MASTSPLAPTPSKEIWFVRHGESMYNKWRRESFRNPCTLLCVCDPKLFDAPLSPKGEAQVRALHDEVLKSDWMSTVELVVTSPLTRAVETCLGAFFPESSYILSPGTYEKAAEHASQDESKSAANSHSYGASPLCCVLPREAMDTSCDVGTSADELKSKYAARLNTSDLRDNVWWYDSKDLKDRATENPQLIVRETKMDVSLRISAFRDWLLQRPEKVIVVVGHSAFIKQFTGMSRKLRNCEVRKYILDAKAEQNERTVETTGRTNVH